MELLPGMENLLPDTFSQIATSDRDIGCLKDDIDEMSVFFLCWDVTGRAGFVILMCSKLPQYFSQFNSVQTPPWFVDAFED